jgi:peptidoglycan DL-endopeptidase LytE
MWRGGIAAVLVLWGICSSSAPVSAGPLYVVRPGDTVYRIARRFHVSPGVLAAFNHLGFATIIHPGQRLAVPDVPGAEDAASRTGVGTRSPADAGPAPEPAILAARHPAALGRTLLPSRSFFGSAAVRIALGFLGRPYQWSGMGRFGFDCSGLVAQVFSMLGLTLPHSSYAQYAAGTPVLRAALFAGDLVFFRTDGPGPSHVGIYVGESRFVHASSSRGVALDSLEDPYFRPRFVGARRL